MKVFRHYETLRYLDALQMSIKISQENEEAWAFNQCGCAPPLWKLEAWAFNQGGCAPSLWKLEACRKMCIQTLYIQTS